MVEFRLADGVGPQHFIGGPLNGYWEPDNKYPLPDDPQALKMVEEDPRFVLVKAEAPAPVKTKKGEVINDG